MSTSASDILLMLFPNIINRLNQLLIKFTHDLDLLSEKKKDKLIYSTPAVATLLSQFPHTYQSYATCIDSFVNIAKNSPESAISVLLTILPNRPNNNLYHRVRKDIDGYTSRSNLYDLIITLFFADCTAQILTVNPDTKFSDELLDFAYKQIEPFSESYEAPLRTTLVKQFSVIVSLLSINHVGKILDNFQNLASKSDPSLFFLLHRFIRLSVSNQITITKIIDFLRTFNHMNPSEKEFQKFFPKFKKTKDIESKTIDANWAHALNSLVTQINVHQAPEFVDVLDEIYKSALNKTTGKAPHLYHVMLCSSIVMRNQNNAKKNYQEFIKDVLLKSKDPKFLEQSLHGFLIIIRGHFCSRTTFFWEWGSFNAMGKPGVEATHLYNPEEDQSQNNSFTNMFFNHFGQLPIEQYPKVVGDILLNFAARDFPFFIQSTIPKLINTVGPNNAIICLQYCLQKIIDPSRQFPEWARDNPRNTSTRIDHLIPLLFNPLKTYLFNTIVNLMPKSQINQAYCFQLTDSKDLPVFSLPFTTDGVSTLTKKRIGYSTINVSKTLEEWKFNEPPSTLYLFADSTTVQQVTDQELKLIRLLEFVPRIVNASDLANDFGQILISMVLSGSKTISWFSIRVINQIFAAVENSRIVIYSYISGMISRTCDPIQIFMLVQLLLKLFDLSLDPSSTVDIITKFICSIHPMLLYLFTFPYCEIRDLAILLIERISKFCKVYKIEFAFNQIFTKLDPIISAVVRYNVVRSSNEKLDIPQSFITLKEAALSQSNPLYRYFLIEIATTYSHLVSTRILMNTIEIYLNILPKQPDEYQSDKFIHYSFLLTVLLHLFPTLHQNQPMSQYLSNRLTPFYEFPSILSKINKKKKDLLVEHTKSMISIIQGILSKISTDQSLTAQTNANISLLSNMNAPMIANFLPVFNKWYADQIPSPAMIIIATGIIQNISQSVELGLALLSFDKCKDSFLSFCQKVQQYLDENKINNETPKFDIGRGDLKIAYNYTEIIRNFVDGLRIQQPPINDGPIRAFEKDPWIEKWPIESKRKTLICLQNLASLAKSNEQQLVHLGRSALRALGSFVRFSRIFDSNHPLTASLEKTLLSIETDNERYLPSILANHRDLLYNNFVDKMFSEPPDVASHYFIAIAYLYYIQVDNSFAKKLGFTLSSNAISTVASLRRVKQTRTVSRCFSDQTFTQFSQELSEEEIALNKEMLNHAPTIIIACFLYLLHKNFTIRKIAFKLIQRLMPPIKTLITPNDPKSVARMMDKIQLIAPTFNSNLTTITTDVVLKLTTIFSKELSLLSDIIIREIFIRIQCAKDGSFLSISSTGFLLKLCKPFFKHQSLYDLNKKKEWPQCLVVFTPFYLMTCLLHISSNIDFRDLNYYLEIWEQFATHKENVSVMIDFLLDFRINGENIDSIKMVLIALAKIDSDSVINGLVSRLSFAFWYHSSIQDQLTAENPPSALDPRHLDRVILTLTELIQPYFSHIIPHIPVIVTFALLYYDQSNYHLTDMILMLMASYPECPDSLTAIIVPPSSIIWPKECTLSASNNIKEFSTADIALHSFSKTPVSVKKYIRDFISFLRDDNKDELITEWGNEVCRWVCGCGDLLVAGRAAYIFAEIMDPVDPITIESVINSLYIVASSKQNELTHFYISACFSLFSSYFVKFSNDEDDTFSDSFMLLFQIAAAFFFLPESNILCQKALAITAEFTKNQRCDNDDIKKLLMRLSALSATLQPKDALYAAILAIFYREKENSPSMIANSTLCCFLPIVYIALCAYRNIQPFTSEIDDTGISNVFRILTLVAETLSCPVFLQQQFWDLTESPENVEPEEFILQACSIFAQTNIASKSAQYLCKAAETAKTEAFLSAIFAVVSGFLQVRDIDPNLITKYAPIVKIAASYKTPQAESLLQVYMTKIPQCTTVSSSIPDVVNDSSPSGSSWEDVVRKLSKCIQDISITLPDSESDLVPYLAIVPLDKESWNIKCVKEVRDKLKNVKVVGHCFVENENLFEEIKKLKLSSGSSLDSLPLPNDGSLFSAYLVHMKNNFVH
ncbi:hypothetical protein TRFO_32007 [Tritrichomonas foetus]|uniref:Uncharacterized protein n=1 Tax=Tritrichomonas foetus TaxID=1144522 RepID=A0A1J4JS18_9EUKA|nr:hypothetical protein TRFO_32007 [Tritrichomonas foetus]|eukprot:OHT01224.1 hypothetical protein TRFO_32007 [Tritrichomonas foetus]